MSNEENIKRMLERMSDVNVISSSMCLAKWLQSTIHLQNGFTHSCHHPSAHKIPVEELEANPSAIHNTSHKKTMRKEMLEGTRCGECQYCWTVEDLPGDHISDRTYKSTDVGWAYPNIDRVLEAGSHGDINPTYLEVSFDNTCNLKCAYCSPDISSKWMEEIKQFGPYPTSRRSHNLDWLQATGRMPIPNRDHNPYLEAFWQWWPDLYTDLHTFRITGGEPLLSKNTWRVLDHIERNPRKDLTLAINTNLSVSDEVVDRFIERVRNLEGKLKEIQIFTSCEATNDAAEYIRYGMNYSKFMRNVGKVLAGTNARVNFMVTFNVLSATTFHYFLKDVWNLRAEHNVNEAENRVPMMISILRWPPFMGARILPRDIKEDFSRINRDLVRKFSRRTSPDKMARFYIEEIDQVDRLCDFMMEDDPELDVNLRDFRLYFREYDRRRGTRFCETFPELVELYGEEDGSL